MIPKVTKRANGTQPEPVPVLRPAAVRAPAPAINLWSLLADMQRS